MSPSIWQILIIVIAIFLLFGAGRLPRIMGDLAKGIRSFKDGLNEEEKPEEPKEIGNPNKKED